MIYYYSATGNTRFAANYLGKKLNTEVIDIIRNGEDPDIKIADSEPVGFMFPIYCWGIPPVMKRVMDAVFPLISKEQYVWVACTCGDEAGTAMRHFNSLLERVRGRGADAIFSVIMPNTYVLLPGFDVDKPEIEERKLKDAPARLDYIAEKIERREGGIYDVSQGSFPALRSAVFPLFERWGVFPKYWKVSDKCIGCGKCEKICPARNIKLADSRPVWGKDCFSCCACFHVCPVKAIDYGSITRKKSQYICPLNR